MHGSGLVPWPRFGQDIETNEGVHRTIQIYGLAGLIPIYLARYPSVTPFT
jgi:hypothetical protein